MLSAAIKRAVLVSGQLHQIAESKGSRPDMGSKLEDILAKGVEEGKIPHAVVFATNKDGKYLLPLINFHGLILGAAIADVAGTGSFTYKHAIGKQNFPEDTPIREDALFLLASQSKLLTSIAALQIVEKGLYGLDEDVARALPELAEQKIIKGFDEDEKPILVDRTRSLTLK
jgi:CubicO group peptidase (beta-lactamase class C family)